VIAGAAGDENFDVVGAVGDRSTRTST